MLVKNYILSILLAKETGLFLYQQPTGSGKTYKTAQAIKDFVLSDTNDKRKVIYLTSLNKNISDLKSELISAFGGDKEVFDRHVLWIRANNAEVLDKLEDLSRDKRFLENEYIKGSKTYEDLLRLVRMNKRAVSFQDMEYKEELERRLRDTESKFRKELSLYLRKKFTNKRERLYAIHNDKKWQWVGILYPAVFSDERQVLLLSVSKFLQKNSPVVEPSYDFLQSRMLKDAVIIVDEFDATKDVIRDEIIQQAFDHSAEYLLLFHRLYHGMEDPKRFSRLMKDAYQKVGRKYRSRYTFTDIKREAESIEKDFHLRLCYKTSEDTVDQKQNFLFRDGFYHTLLANNKKYIRATKNAQDNRVDIFFETEEEYRKNHDAENDIHIFKMLRSIHRFLVHFQIFLSNWAEEYMEIVNGGRGPHADAMTMDNAISTILTRFELDERERDVIFSQLQGMAMNQRKKGALPDYSFYQRGMEIIELEDGDAHNETTDMSLVSISKTPEKLLLSLAKTATVIALSATADVPGVLSNFDLDYLKEQLGGAFHPTPDEEKERLQKERRRQHKPYRNGKIIVRAEAVEDSPKDFANNIREFCEKKIFHPGSIHAAKIHAAKCAREIENAAAKAAGNRDSKNSISDSMGFFARRYCNIAYAMHCFFARKIESLLYLGMNLPKENKPEMDESLIRSMFCYIKDYYKPNGEYSLVILRSHGYDDQKKELIEKLEKGEKVFIISTYQTVSAGQNFQYKPFSSSQLVELVPDKGGRDGRHAYKDLDALYLADITHLTINPRGPLSREDRIRFLFQIEELQEHGELFPSDAEELIAMAFQPYGTIKASAALNALKKCQSARLLATRNVIQAVGRICRAFLKSPWIYIFAEKNLLDKIDLNELKKQGSSPELDAVIRLREEHSMLPADPLTQDEKALKEADKISQKAQRMIEGILTTAWDGKWEDDMIDIWKRLRETVLRYPTASAETASDDDLIRRLYITSGESQNRYFYSRFSDFKQSVTVDFGTDRKAFKKRVEKALGMSSKKKREDTFIYEMAEETSGLPYLLKYPGLREYFEEKGYATLFKKADYMMSPAVFHNIYKGAIGEKVGCFILQRELGITLEEITNPECFEVFDFQITEGVYVDFKHWKTNFLVDHADMVRKIREKLDRIKGKRVYIINIVGDPKFEPKRSIDGKVVEIPCLIDKEGQPIPKNLRVFEENDLFRF